MTEFKTVAILGSGVLGSQIAMQAAYHGKDVTIFDPFQESLDKLPARWDWMRRGYSEDLSDFSEPKFEDALSRISTTTELAEVVSDVDIVIEAVPENLDLKRETWEKVGKLADARTVLATNTSSLLPSLFADSTGAPERFVAIHYANRIWSQNLAEVMGTPKTDPAIVDKAVAFAEETGMVPVRVEKETPGYFLNSLLIPWLRAGSALYINGVGEPEAIDNAWKAGTHFGRGPFEVYDVVGFNVAANISRNSEDETEQRFAAKLQEAIDAGFSGIADGKGFYLYDKDGNITGPNDFFTK
ncbi:3-hydroxybutyryl-CoA dehydrogenase [Brevibacterium paucivorans]|uniref:3-hydroxybutyryl-CoA dehydrogenase n=1 Tax=Brevibacterium paucivorans TaxID=170994 RepID=A0ABS2SI48_9MICO|nr:3-hydroxyacyl-CoA dehydrogenase [Brevibacterium paucivorans]MBM7815455.1 3-hydroxybutyryl-CoA dehydrogenase [Brevibacterium paucivorans]